jgi:hypothetical protein
MLLCLSFLTYDKWLCVKFVGSFLSSNLHTKFHILASSIQLLVPWNWKLYIYLCVCVCVCTLQTPSYFIFSHSKSCKFFKKSVITQHFGTLLPVQNYFVQPPCWCYWCCKIIKYTIWVVFRVMVCIPSFKKFQHFLQNLFGIDIWLWWYYKPIITYKTRKVH